MLIAAITVAGFLTSMLSGVAGLGGGTILIGLFYAIGMAPVEAVPLFAAVQFVSNTSRTVAYVQHVEWHAAGWFLLAAIPATFLVAPLVENVDVDAVRLILGGLILASLAPSKGGDAALPPRPAFVLAGLLNGSVGMFVGATGLFVGRLFLRPEWPRERVIGTLAFTQSLGHLLRVAGYGVAGFTVFTQWRTLLPLCLSVILGTMAGRWLNTRVPEALFVKLFKAILLVLSLKLLYDGVRGFGWI